jgi:UDP-N-acetylmuramyl pentapeptide phosphotransferase/UDP-N-acetylglucosamine-1-phosphate transferase
MKEILTLKKMLVDAHNELRSRKQKNTPTFGAMMFMLGAIVQCNKAICEKEKNENQK